jgi:hypothetical protein
MVIVPALADIITAAGPGGGAHLKAFNAASSGTAPDEIRSVLVENPSFTGGIFVAASTPLETITPTLGSANEGLNQLFGDGDLLEALLS